MNRTSAALSMAKPMRPRCRRCGFSRSQSKSGFCPSARGRVADLAAEGVEFSQAEIGRALAGEVGCGVPAPLRLRAQRHLALVRLGKGLQAREVGGEGEFAVADGEWRARIKSVQRRVVARDHGAAVEPGGSTGLCGERGGHSSEESTARYSHAFRVIPISGSRRSDRGRAGWRAVVCRRGNSRSDTAGPSDPSEAICRAGRRAGGATK